MTIQNIYFASLMTKTFLTFHVEKILHMSDCQVMKFSRWQIFMWKNSPHEIYQQNLWCWFDVSNKISVFPFIHILLWSSSNNSIYDRHLTINIVFTDLRRFKINVGRRRLIMSTCQKFKSTFNDRPICHISKTLIQICLVNFYIIKYWNLVNFHILLNLKFKLGLIIIYIFKKLNPNLLENWVLHQGIIKVTARWITS